MSTYNAPVFQSGLLQVGLQKRLKHCRSFWGAHQVSHSVRLAGVLPFPVAKLKLGFASVGACCLPLWRFRLAPRLLREYIQVLVRERGTWGIKGVGSGSRVGKKVTREMGHHASLTTQAAKVDNFTPHGPRVYGAEA